MLSPAATSDAAPALAAEIVQLRRDEVLQRVEVAVTNLSAGPVVIDDLDLQVPGYSGAGVQQKSEPLPAGQRVNLPTAYGEVACTADRPQVGRPRVVLRVHTASAPRPRRVVLAPTDPQGLLERIAAGVCLQRRLAREVTLRFDPGWRLTGRGEDVALHGRLIVTLATEETRDITQVAGTVIFNLAPDVRPGTAGDDTGDDRGGPLLRLTAEAPEQSLPVLVTRSRCDGHARAETKKPYGFLVWVSAPGEAEHAVTPEVSAADQDALDAVCPL